MDIHKVSDLPERLTVVELGRRRRWSEEEKLRIVLESLEAPRLAERVNDFETPGSRIQAWSIPVFGGGLIHAAMGLAGGLGVNLTKRCGVSVKARSRTLWRAS